MTPRTTQREPVTTEQAEIGRLRTTLRRGVELVREMDARMPEQATEDEDGFINSYRIPVGPWHRLLGWIVEADYVGGTEERMTDNREMRETLREILSVAVNEGDAVEAVTQIAFLASSYLAEKDLEEA